MKNIINNFKKAFVSSWIVSINSFLCMMMMARLLVPDKLGEIAVCVATASIINKLLNLQTWQALINMLGNENNRADNIATALFVDLLTTLLSILVFWVYGWIFSESPWEIFWVIFLIAFRPWGVFYGVLRYADRFDLILYGNAISSFLRLIIVFIGFHFSFGKEYFLFTYSAEVVVLFILLFYFTKRECLQLYGVNLNCNVFRTHTSITYFLKFSVYSNLSSGVRGVSTDGVVLAVDLFLGSASVAYLKIMQQIVLIFEKLVSPVSKVIYPEYSKMIDAGNIFLISQVDRKINFLLAVFSAISIILFYFIGEFLIHIFFGEQYAMVRDPAFLYLTGTCLKLLTITVAPIYWSCGKVKESFLLELFATSAQMFVLIIMIDEYQLFSVGMSLVVYMFVYLMISRIRIKKILKEEVCVI